MKLAKHTLLIDGNYFLHSRLFVLPRNKVVNKMSDKESQKILMRKLNIDFASEIRKMGPFIDQVVVAVDAKSWRKDLFPEAQYKGTREYDDTIDWEAVFNVYQEWQKILATKGVIIHQIDGAEADDVLFGWSTLLNNQGKNCIVWTGDRDLIQLVNYNDAMDSYTLWYYNSSRNLIAFEGFTELLEKEKADNISNDDLLFNMSSNEVMHDKMINDLKQWINKNNVSVEEVDCDTFIFSKILQGDKSDNIKSVVTWTKATSKGSIRNYSISEKMSIKVLKQFYKECGDFKIDMFFNQDAVNHISDIIHRVVKRSTEEEIKVRFNQNIDLMLLHYNTIPEAIQTEIYKNIEADIEQKPEFKNISKVELILEGTDWAAKKGSGAPSGYDPFAGLEKSKSKKVTENKDINKLF